MVVKARKGVRPGEGKSLREVRNRVIKDVYILRKPRRLGRVLSSQQRWTSIQFPAPTSRLTLSVTPVQGL